MALTSGRSAAQVDKDAHIRKLGGKVKPQGRLAGTTNPARKIASPKPRSAAQVEKDALARQMGKRVAPRGRLSDAATGRLSGTKLSSQARSAFSEQKHPRNPKSGKFRPK